MENLTPEQTTKIAPLKVKLSNLGPKIKAIVEQGRLIANDPSQLFLFKGMYKELKPYLDSYNNHWDKLTELYIEMGKANAFPSQQEKATLQAVERYYYEACAIYEQHMNPTPPAPLPSTSALGNSTLSDSRTVRARFPQINLPSFDGTAIDWPLFRDTFSSLIHDETSLSDIEKFHFLISSLKGPALALIKGIQLQASNYIQAWHLLNTTYNNKRKLAAAYLKSILDFSPLKGRPNANTLKELLVTVGESMESFKNLQIPNGEDFILFYLGLRCLDTETRRAFEKQHDNLEFPTYQLLLSFIRSEWRSLDLSTEETENPLTSRTPHMQYSKHFKDNRTKSSFFIGTNEETKATIYNRPNRTHPNQEKGKVQGLRCPVCKHPHTLYQCETFKRKTPAEKLSALKNWQGCTNCLSSKHLTKNCTSLRTCQACGQCHHSWLHQPEPQERHSFKAAPQTNVPCGTTSLSSLSKQGEVLLGTAVINVQSNSGNYCSVRVVTDSGSQRCFITETCAKKLKLPIVPCDDTISGIGQSTLIHILGKTTCKLRPKGKTTSSYDLTAEAIVVPKIAENLPRHTLPSSTQRHYTSYSLADPEFWKPGPVEFLLGGDLYFDIIVGRPIIVDQEAPRLLPTIYGYVIGGPSKNGSSSSKTSSALFTQSEGDLQEAISRFWEVEELPKTQILSDEDKLVEQHFVSTHYRTPTGRYVVSLPLKESISTLENPRNQALSRYLNLETKLSKDANLKQEYHRFMKEYVELEHMKLAVPGSAAYTIPHHAVLKWQNEKMKLRTVFDASCKSQTGSLNDHMYIGPKLQLDICDIITQFRTHKVVFTADIVKMYRQILIHPPDRKFQHILWRFHPTEAVQEYELQTVT